jgi:hypothetical protein
MLKPPQDIHRFLFSSSAHVVGVVETDSYLLMPAFPSLDTAMQLFYTPGPNQRSFVSVTIRIKEAEVDPAKPPQRNNYNWLADHLAVLLCGFYGKLVVNHGYTNWGDIFSVPHLGFDHTVDHALPPFNSSPRAATKLPDMNLAHTKALLSAFLKGGGIDDAWASITNAAAFYQQALTLYSERPHLSFTLLLSSLECLLPLIKYNDDEIYDERLLEDLSTIGMKIEGGVEIVNRLKSRLFQIRRKCALFVRQTLDEQFYQSSESTIGFLRVSRNDIERHVKAAYDLRSRFMHSGRSHGGWVNAMKHAGAEIVIGDPVIKDPELKKLVVDSLTLCGLERVVQYCLHRSILNRISSTSS